MTLNAKAYDPHEWMRDMQDPETDACMRGVLRDNQRAASGRPLSPSVAADDDRRAVRMIETNNGAGWGAFRDGALTLAEWWAKERPGEPYVPSVAADARREDKARRSAEWQRSRNRIGGAL